MSRKLTDQEVSARMVELRNLRRLHARDRKQIDQLKTELAKTRRENEQLKQTISTLQLQIAELQTIVFGKKKRPPAGGTPAGPPNLFATPKQPRSKDSYRRSIPPESAVTQEVVVPLPAVCDCGGSFSSTFTTTHERYQEDIPLPELTPGYKSHLVTKYVVARGVCLACGKATSGKDLGGAQVALGPNVRLLTAHLIASMGMSYAQVSHLMLSLYGLRITDGEITNILQKQHQAWHSAYEQLKADIRAAPVVHADETPWAIQNNDSLGYAWALADANSPKVCFALEQSRGARHAKALFGEATPKANAELQLNPKPFVGVRISDDYAAYRSQSLPGNQQLCWAHLYRAIRDLRYNTNLPEKQLPYVSEWYASFASIYQDLRHYLAQPYDKVVRKRQATEMWRRTQELAEQLAPRESGEPQKLSRLKAQLLRAGKARLFVCLQKDTPCDNNRAERDLRQLVLKRKRSFGSKTERGASALATVLSLCTTTCRTTPPTRYFSALASLVG